MAALPVKVSLQIVGNNIVSDDIYVKQYAVIGKAEKEFFEIKSTDGYLPISVSKMGSISHILAYSTSAKLKITTNTVPPTTPTITEIPINGKLYWEVPSTFSDLITAVELATDSLTIVNAEVSVWGVDADV